MRFLDVLMMTLASAAAQTDAGEVLIVGLDVQRDAVGVLQIEGNPVKVASEGAENRREGVRGFAGLFPDCGGSIA